MRSSGVSLQEIQNFFRVLEQSKTNNDMQIIIDNEMCKTLQDMIESLCIIKTNEIERLNNIINELEKWAKEELEQPNWASCGARCMLDKLKELQENTQFDTNQKQI